MKRIHVPHKIRTVEDWNDTIPVGTVVVVSDTLITTTTSSAYATRRCHSLIRVVRVAGRGAVPIEKVRIPKDLGGEFVDRRYNAI